MELSKSARNVPIGELNNIYFEYGLVTDVNCEEILLFSTDACNHLNVVKLLDGRFVCLKCQDTRNVSFGKNIV